MIGNKGFVGVPVLLGADNSPRSTTVHHSAAGIEAQQRAVRKSFLG